MLEQGPNVSGLLEPDWVECRPLGASGSMTPWWPPSRGMGIGSRGFVMCLDLLTSVLMKMREGSWGGINRSLASRGSWGGDGSTSRSKGTARLVASGQARHGWLPRPLSPVFQGAGQASCDR